MFESGVNGYELTDSVTDETSQLQGTRIPPAPISGSRVEQGGSLPRVQVSEDVSQGALRADHSQGAGQ